jgi:hypothetical protein
LTRKTDEDDLRTVVSALLTMETRHPSAHVRRLLQRSRKSAYTALAVASGELRVPEIEDEYARTRR